LLKFTIEGPGRIVGLGNANPVSLESYQLPQRKAWRGKCLVIIKSERKEGEIKLMIQSENITSSSILINVEN
jgi:beta-galactosidase